MMQCELGRSELHVSPLRLGGNVFDWTVDCKTSFDLLDAWLDAGLNFVDTADSYSTSASADGDFATTRGAGRIGASAVAGDCDRGIR